jgi:ribosomal protein L21
MSLDPRRWIDEPAVLEKHGHITVVREDTLDGGSKLRFLPFLVQGAQEVVFGAPFCGGAPLALSVLGRESGQKITIFYAARKTLHARQEKVKANGARLEFVSPGYMTVVQAKARAYAAASGAMFLPLGFDVPAAADPFIEAIAKVRAKVGDPPEVWCATGSGMLARCLGVAFPSSKVIGVCVGLKSRHDKQEYQGNVELREHPLDFARESKAESPFPSCPNYDLKAWELCAKEAKPGALFWNVLGAG